MTTVQPSNVFSIREKGYDVGEVTAHIAALEARVARLETDAPTDGTATRLLTEARRDAIRVLASAREDAEAMVEEARREAAAIVASARSDAAGSVAMPTLDPELESIKASLPTGTQMAFVSVAQRRGD